MVSTSCNVVFTFLFYHAIFQVVIDNSRWRFRSELVSVLFQVFLSAIKVIIDGTGKIKNTDRDIKLRYRS
jgi:hypothetical protein